jgi:hypothetical protein
MPTIQVSEEMYARLALFRPLAEAVVEAELDIAGCVDLMLEQGLQRTLADLVGDDSAILLKSLQQLAARHPDHVYPYLSEVLKDGALAKQREELQRRIGFRLPKTESTAS